MQTRHRSSSIRFAELQDRADAGDVAAATRLVVDLSLCHRFRAMDWGNQLLANELLDESTEALATAQIAGYNAQLDAIDSRARNTQRLHALCDDANDADLDALVPSVKKAAELGDPEARACYVALGPDYDSSGLLRHPQWLAAYRSSIPAMIDAGMAAGDWRIVRVVRDALQPGADGLLSGALGSDPLQHYRYLRLSRLGAQPGDVDAFDKQLVAAAAILPQRQRKAADDWARRTFEASFHGRAQDAVSDAGLDPCIFVDATEDAT